MRVLVSVSRRRPGVSRGPLITTNISKMKCQAAYGARRFWNILQSLAVSHPWKFRFPLKWCHSICLPSKMGVYHRVYQSRSHFAIREVNVRKVHGVFGSFQNSRPSTEQFTNPGISPRRVACVSGKYESGAEMVNVSPTLSRSFSSIRWPWCVW